jgi:Integrase core domain.
MGHVGLDKTIELITRVYWFPKIRERVKEHIANCLTCITYTVPSGKSEGEMHIWDKARAPFEMIYVDHYGPLDKSERGNRHILMLVDGYTKFCVMYPVKSTSSGETIGKIEQYFIHYGTPKGITTDRGTCFTSEEFDNFMQTKGVRHVKTATGTPRANGQVERIFRFLRSTMSKVATSREWDVHLGTCNLL